MTLPEEPSTEIQLLLKEMTEVSITKRRLNSRVLIMTRMAVVLIRLRRVACLTLYGLDRLDRTQLMQ